MGTYAWPTRHVNFPYLAHEDYLYEVNFPYETCDRKKQSKKIEWLKNGDPLSVYIYIYLTMKAYNNCHLSFPFPK